VPSGRRPSVAASAAPTADDVARGRRGQGDRRVGGCGVSGRSTLPLARRIPKIRPRGSCGPEGTIAGPKEQLRIRRKTLVIRYLRRRVGRAAIVMALAMVMVGGGASVALAGVQARSGTATATKKAKVPVVKVTLADTQGLTGPMTLTATPASVKAGKVKFVVKNAGSIVHELIVLNTTTPFDQLPVADAGDPPAPVTSGANKVSEATKTGETGDVAKGKTKSVTLKLKKGSYALVCNIAQHYGLGMRSALSVT
jgi:uncharacterized cupredoxin-like copper-binding protein